MKGKLIIVCCLFVSCSNRIMTPVGIYKSSCEKMGDPSVQIALFDNHQFVYTRRYTGVVSGEWKISNDTLFLTSKLFSEKYKEEVAEKLISDDSSILTKYTKEQLGSWTPKLQNTNNKEVDIYLIQKDKLFIVNDTGVYRSCYLMKMGSKSGNKKKNEVW